jgi:SAM-dependent methyltransferase
VRPGDVVLDLGAGTGVLAMLAARAGAARVHAVESMPVAQLARRIVAANGLADRVTVHHGDAVTLPPVEPVDLVVSDFLGRFLVDDQMLPAVAAAGRWLKPSGRFCPSSVRLQLAPVADAYLETVATFEAPCYGLDFSAAVDDGLNTCSGISLRPQWVVAPPQRFADYRPPAPFALADYDATLDFTLERTANLRGLAGWFVADLAPGVTLSTEPGVETHWGQVFFPLPDTAVEAGDELRACLQLTAPGDPAPEWRWSGELRRRGTLLLAFDLDSLGRHDTRPLVDAPPAAEPADRRDAICELNQRGAAAFDAKRLADAIDHWEAVIPLIGDDEADLLHASYENLGLAWFNRGNFIAAARNFLRALDGDLGRRQKSLRYLVLALLSRGRRHDARRYLVAYEQRYGAHPDGVTSNS